MSVVHVVIRRCPGGSGGRCQCSGARPREAGDARPGGGVRGSTGRSARARPTWRRPHGNDRFHMPGRGAVAERDAVPAAATDQGASRVAPNRTTLIFLARFVTRREKAWTRQRGLGTSASSSAISSERRKRKWRSGFGVSASSSAQVSVWRSRGSQHGQSPRCRRRNPASRLGGRSTSDSWSWASWACSFWLILRPNKAFFPNRNCARARPLFGVSTNVLVCHWLTSRVYGVTCPPPPAQVLYLPLLLRTLPSTFVFHMSMSALNEPLKVMEPELRLRFRVPWRQESFSSPPCSPTFTQPLPRQA